MADTSPPERLPIKVVLPNQGDRRSVPSGRSPPKPFRDVDDEFRASLAEQVMAIRRGLARSLTTVGVAPLRVKLIPRAYAKSHRPRALFSNRTCPIVGAGQLGELFVKATHDGLSRLQETIEANETQYMVKQLSTVQLIEAVTPAFRRKRKSPADVQRSSPRIDDEFFLTRVRLFDLGGTAQNDIEDDFWDVCRGRNLGVSRAGYQADDQTFAVSCRTTEDVEALSRIVGVRSVIGMPLLRTIRNQAANPMDVPDDVPTADQVEGEYPLVAVVDSGINDSVAALDSWVAARRSTVAVEYRNTSHGTFVGGLIVYGDRLNPHLKDVSSDPCGVVDIQVLPNDDPDLGEVELLSEQEFLVALEDALRAHADTCKVWNLSLSTDEVCGKDEFSSLAVELDNLQERHGVTFVLAAGNYNTRPLLAYPRRGDEIQLGRITAPADSVLGITVGAISHVNFPINLGPRLNEPSPFSRHGEGPNYTIKPDLVHYGGTCTRDGGSRNGLRSITEHGTGENLGTSFSAPLVSRALAQIYHQVSPTPDPVLARALLIHHARDPRSQGRVPDGEENSLGFGRPAPPPYCLECSPNDATLIFSDVLVPGLYCEWDDFPYPPSLIRNGHYFGQISMTVAYEPRRGARWGVEYCETNIDAKFGTYTLKPDKEPGRMKEVFASRAPPEHRNPGLLYEETQVRELRKWAPVRTYFGDLGEKGTAGLRWRLKVSLLSRHDSELEREPTEQPFALILTISDPAGTAPVYDEMVRAIQTRWQIENLNLRVGARLRARN